MPCYTRACMADEAGRRPLGRVVRGLSVAGPNRCCPALVAFRAKKYRMAPLARCLWSKYTGISGVGWQAGGLGLSCSHRRHQQALPA